MLALRTSKQFREWQKIECSKNLADGNGCCQEEHEHTNVFDVHLKIRDRRAQKSNNVRIKRIFIGSSDHNDDQCLEKIKQWTMTNVGSAGAEDGGRRF